MGRKLSTSELARLWSCSQDSIRDYVHDGMPHTTVIKNDKAYYYFDLDACQKWWAGGWLDNKKGGEEKCQTQYC